MVQKIPTRLSFLVAAFFACLINVNAQKISAGLTHSLFSCPSGIPQGVGSNTNGQLGLGSWVTPDGVVSIPLLSGIIAVDTNFYHSLFLKNDGTVWAAGVNEHGELGDGTTDNQIAPVQVLGLSGITAISASQNFSLFLKNDGTVWGVGKNDSGQLGDGTNEDKSIAVQVSGLTGIIAISTGLFHSLFLKNDGTVWATGANDYGQIGSQSFAGVNTLVPINGVSDIIAISAGGTHSLFLKNDHTVWGVGDNFFGQLGNANVGHYIYSAFQIGDLNGIIKLSGGFRHSLFLKVDGTVLASGMNYNGQLGDGTTVSKSVPTPVSGLTGVVDVYGGVFSSLFLENDGSVMSVGINGTDQVDGTNVEHLTPVPVLNACAIPLSLPEQTIDETLAIYPNPCDRELFVELRNPDLEDGGVTAELFNLRGQLLQTTVLKTNFSAIPIDDLEVGIYVVRLKSQSRIYSKKIVKK